MQSNPQASAPGAAAPVTLESLRDRYRPLLVFAASDQDAKFLEQEHLLAGGASEIRARQILVIPLIQGGGNELWAEALAPGLMARLSVDEAAAARRRFTVQQSEFTVILLGKDGGEKFRTHNPVTMKRLNTVIDAMPMRQQEIRDGHAN